MLDRILIGASSTETTDPDFENVTLLLHGDGSNGAQNNTFIDSSTNNFTITRNGNTTQGSFSPYGSNWSNYFDGTGDYLSAPSNSAFAYGTGSFTVELWFFASSVSGTEIPIYKQHNSGAANGDTVEIRISSSKIYGYIENTSFGGTTTLSPNTWYHVAYVRNGSTCTLYLNGVSEGSASNSLNFSTNPTTVRIGTNQVAANFFTGYISNARIVKGTAVYTSAFTPSTTPLTAITNTSLLTCADNRFRDGSTNNFTITRNGDVKVTNFAPFAPSSAYSTTTNGGSAYLNGTSSYLTAPSNSAFTFGTGDFCLELWVFHETSGSSEQYFDQDTAGVSVSKDTANKLVFAKAGTAVLMTSSGTVPIGQWAHLAITRSGSSVRMFINGVLDSTATLSTDFSATSILAVGRNALSAVTYMRGYISNLRVVKGSAVYTAAFTPPTSPVTAITNTSLLLNATNAAIFDNSMKNDLETVGNAQISTSVKKFGTGSIYLDGSGDWLTCATTDVNKFGSGDFTIEGWIYRNNSSDGGFYSDRVASPDYSGMVIYIKSDKVAMLVSTNGSSWGLNTVAATEGNSVPTTAWSHLAITRSGSTWRVFIDGTLSYSKTLSGSVSQTQSVAYIGADIPDGKYLNGYIDDLRITKGVARYTANFTAPTAPFPNK